MRPADDDSLFFLELAGCIGMLSVTNVTFPTVNCTRNALAPEDDVEGDAVVVFLSVVEFELLARRIKVALAAIDADVELASAFELATDSETAVELLLAVAFEPFFELATVELAEDEAVSAPAVEFFPALVEVGKADDETALSVTVAFVPLLVVELEDTDGCWEELMLNTISSPPKVLALESTKPTREHMTRVVPEELDLSR